MASDANAGGSVYFGYGSNLWLHQMLSLRCPNSKYIGIGRLTGYRWLINERGVANVIPSFRQDELRWKQERYREEAEDVVYGLVYTLTPKDEKILDVNEGAPRIYQKHTLEVELFPAKGMKRVDISPPGEKRKMLVYVDVNNVADDEPRPEYVWRMNNGIKDALEMGIPREYVESAMRPFIPDEPTELESEETKRLAQSQAMSFNDTKDPSSKNYPS